MPTSKKELRIEYKNFRKKLSLDDVEEKFVKASYTAGVISKDLYDKTRAVRDIDVFRGEDGVMLADTSKLENDPSYLRRHLAEKLKDQTVFGTTVIRK